MKHSSHKIKLQKYRSKKLFRPRFKMASDNMGFRIETPRQLGFGSQTMSLFSFWSASLILFLHARTTSNIVSTASQILSYFAIYHVTKDRWPSRNESQIFEWWVSRQTSSPVITIWRNATYLHAISLVCFRFVLN